MSVEHYENFPVASRWLPKRVRQPIAVIYRFARRADDLADEGNLTPHERLTALAAFGLALHRLEAGWPQVPEPELSAAAISLKAERGWMSGDVFAALAETVRRHRLGIHHFHDLLCAFRQDVACRPFLDWSMLADYCRRSANPVGRLMLELYGHARGHAWSDAICTGLQLANFVQDLSVDLRRNRCYIPQTELQQLGQMPVDATPTQVLAAMAANDAICLKLIVKQIRRARRHLLAGAPLAMALPGRLGWELRCVVQGGLRILERAENLQQSLLHERPRLGAVDAMIVVGRAVAMSWRTPFERRD